MIRRSLENAFPTDEDWALIEQSQGLCQLTDRLNAWLEQFADLRSEDHATAISEQDQFRLLELTRLAGALRASSKVPVAAAIYGPSQVGKSLLVGRLLRPRDGAGTSLGRVAAEPGSDAGRLSFEADLNPQCGDNEATALVTRFTISERLDPALPAEYPVLVRALSRAQWLCVVARGFQVECRDPATTWDSAALDTLLSELHRDFAAARADRSWRRDLVEAYAYLHEGHGRMYPAGPEELNQLLGRWPLAADGYYRLAARLFWDGWPGLSDLFRRVCEFLQQLEHRDTDSPQANAAGPAEADTFVLTEWAGVRFLLDTQRAAAYHSPGLGQVDWSAFTLSRAAGEPAFILARRPAEAPLPSDLPLLQAAMLEMVIPVLPERLEEATCQVLERMDLLDIPGMRVGRAGGPEQGKRTSADALEEQLEIIKRGKVAYLFERYTDERLVQTLLLLARGGNLEVTGYLKSHVERWGRSRYAERWPDRVTEQPAALFVGLTGIDAEFRNRGDRATAALYDARLKQLRDALHPLLENSSGHALANIFPLRYPGTWDGDAQSRSSEGEDKWAAAGEAFLASSLVARHVTDAAAKWQASMLDNDGGVSLLCQGLLESTHARRKRDQLRSALQQAAASLVELARGWLVTEGPAGDRELRLALGEKIMAWLRADRLCTCYRVYALKHSLCLRVDEAHALAELADVRRLPPLEARLPVEHRLADDLGTFLEHWSVTLAPTHWASYMQGQRESDARTFNRLFAPDEFTSADFALLTRYLHDFFRSADEFGRLVHALLPIVRLRLPDETAARAARATYVRLVLNDCLMRPGMSWLAPPEPEPASGENEAWGLMNGFVRQWQRQLPAALAGGANGRHVPAGNHELRELLQEVPDALAELDSTARAPAGTLEGERRCPA
jgi:hypothetical protein